MINEILNIEKSVVGLGLVQVALKLNEVIRAQNAAELAATDSQQLKVSIAFIKELMSDLQTKDYCVVDFHNKISDFLNSIAQQKTI